MAYEQIQAQSVELKGDYVEFLREENKFVAEGNVEISRDNVTLRCDKLEISRETSVAVAQGNVVVHTLEGGHLTGEHLVYNFETGQGEFKDAKIYSAPFYGAGAKISKVDDNHYVIEDGYLTTSDFDKPEYRLTSKKIDIYPGDKAVARNIRLLLGNNPVAYIPRYTQKLTDRKPLFSFTPGSDKDWGGFLLTQTRYYLNDNFKGVIHVDYREKKDVATGIDLDYTTPKWGSGILRTYYINEVDRGVFEDPVVTGERERYKVEWRHQWQIDEKTNAIWQYYRLTDAGFLKDYFENEFEEDPNPETFFLLTRVLGNGTLSLRSDIRVNDFVGTVERLPEVQYNLTNQKLGPTNFYIKSNTLYSKLVRNEPAPSEVRKETVRLDTENEISHPLKVGFVEFRPSIGTRQTYYSRTRDTVNKSDIIRGQLLTGADLSTKFYKIFDIKTKFLGQEINRIRHIITPSVDYTYKSEPTHSTSELDQFDSVDSISRAHGIGFSLENKFQTKRDDGESVDLLRLVVGTDFRLKDDPGKGGFGDITSDIDFKPADWVEFFFDSDFDSRRGRLKEANFDIYLRDKATRPRWSVNVSKRLNVDVDDVVTSAFSYKINPKWTFEVYGRFDTAQGFVEEQEYKITRDLHTWEMDVILNDKRKGGTEVLFVFRLKAFPEIGFDFGQTFRRRRSGSNE